MAGYFNKFAASGSALALLDTCNRSELYESATRVMIEQILKMEEQHANDLADLLVKIK